MFAFFSVALNVFKKKKTIQDAGFLWAPALRKKREDLYQTREACPS